VIVISAWKSAGDKPHTSTRTAPAAKTPKAVPPHFLVTARRGATHVTVRIGSASGAVRWDGTLQVGDDPVAIRGSRRLWVQIDSPENVQVAVRGKPVHVRTSGPAVRIVTATGWHRP
jgi:hypothetical protein